MYRSRVKYYGITSNLARNLTLHFFSEMKIFKFELTFFSLFESLENIFIKEQMTLLKEQWILRTAECICSQIFFLLKISF